MSDTTGPVFPSHDYYGISYREWLIGQALAGACSIPGPSSHAAMHAIASANEVLKMLDAEKQADE